MGSRFLIAEVAQSINTIAFSASSLLKDQDSEEERGIGYSSSPRRVYDHTC